MWHWCRKHTGLNYFAYYLFSIIIFLMSCCYLCHLYHLQVSRWLSATSVCWVCQLWSVLTDRCWMLSVEFCCQCSTVHMTHCWKSLVVKCGVICLRRLVPPTWYHGVLCCRLKLRLLWYSVSVFSPRLAMLRTTSLGFVFVSLMCLWFCDDVFIGNDL